MVDNTNRDKATRKLYVDLAKKEGVSVRWVGLCVWIEG